MRRASLLALALAFAGCGVDASGTVPLARPDRALFDEEAGPLLAKTCGDASCHGNPDHEFSLYAVGRRRMDPSLTFSSTPLSTAEEDANYRATLGFIDAPVGRDTTLLRRALGLEAGHKVIFEAQSDPECRAIERWIEGVPR